MSGPVPIYRLTVREEQVHRGMLRWRRAESRWTARVVGHRWPDDVSDTHPRRLRPVVWDLAGRIFEHGDTRAAALRAAERSIHEHLARIEELFDEEEVEYDPTAHPRPLHGKPSP